MRLLSLTMVLLVAAPAVAQRKNAPSQPARKKTVAEVLSQARDESRGGKVRFEKSGTSLPQSKVEFGGQAQSPNLEAVKPPRSSELMRANVSGDTAEYVRVLNRQIDELYKLTQKFKASSNRGEMWLRLAELYVEKATILDTIAQDEYDRKLADFQKGRSKKKPVLDQREAREFNRKAVQLYEWFERDFPRDQKISQAYFFLGFNHFELGNVQKGVEYYQRLTERFPDNPFVNEAHFALGEYYFENDRWSQAYKEYSPLLKQRNHRLHTFALYKGAWCLYRMGRNKEALNYLEVIIKTGKKESGGENLAGKRTVNRTRLEAEALRDIVQFYAVVGSSEQATSYFRNLVGGDPTPYLERLAYYYAEKGNRDSSDEVFKQLIAANPNHPKAFEYQYQIVQNYFYAKNSPKFREELYRWVKDYGPESAWAQANKGNKELISNSQKLRETTLRNWTLQQHQTAQNSRAQYSQSLANEGYQLYLREFPQAEHTADMRFYYGELLYDMGKFDESATQYQWIVENAPKHKFADKAATNLILSVEKGVPDDKELAAKVGSSLEPVPLDPRTERFIKAGRWYITRFPNAEKVPEVKFRIGRLYYQSNQFDPASTEFRDIVQKHPKTKYAEYSANLLLDIYSLRKDYVGLEKAGAELLADPSIASSKAGADIRGVLEKASFKRAQDLEGEKKYSESAQQFETFGKQNPTSSLAVNAFFNAGVNYERGGERGRSAANYREVLNAKGAEAEKLKPRTRRLLAKISQEAGQVDEAADLYRQSALENPKDPLAANMMYNAALLYQVGGKDQQALQSYDAFIKMNKKHQENMEAMFAMGQIHDKRNQTSAALVKYKDYLAGAPRSPENVMEATGRIYEISKARRFKDTEEWRKKTIATYRSLAARKVNPKYAARAKLDECEIAFAELRSVRFGTDPGKLKQRLELKADVLARMLRETAEVIKFNSSDEIVSALSMSGQAYEHMAESLRGAPMPSGLSSDEQKQYRDGVEKQFVEPNVVKAREFHEKAVSRAWELQAYPTSYQESLSYMAKVNPKIYYNQGEAASESRFVNWMGQ